MFEKQRRVRSLSTTLMVLVIGLCLTGPAAAQEYVFSLGLAGGFTGSLDEDDAGFSNTAFHARFAVETSARQHVAVRLGRMDFGNENLSLIFDPTIDYLTISGEYLFTESGYESGFFIGLGFYDLAGIRPDGRSGGESSIGLQLGAIGEFRLADRWFIFVEAAFHYASLEAAQIFGDLQVGVGFRF